MESGLGGGGWRFAVKARERRQFQRPARTDEPEFLPSQGTFPSRWEGRAAYDAERDVACL